MSTKSCSRRSANRSNPLLWKRIVTSVKAGDKGGEPGSWSARKAQLAVFYYKKRGGSYTGPKSSCNSLSKWSKEQWGYIGPVDRGDRSKYGEKSKSGRYLPLKVRRSLTKKEKSIENRRKGSRRGEWVSYSPSVLKKMRKYKII
jgi:hypothetical protein